jgi:hypothetical protein
MAVRVEGLGLSLISIIILKFVWCWRIGTAFMLSSGGAVASRYTHTNHEGCGAVSAQLLDVLVLPLSLHDSQREFRDVASSDTIDPE